MDTAVMEKEAISADETYEVDGIVVNVTYAQPTDVPMSEQEIKAYIDRGNCHHPGCTVRGLNLTVDGDDIDITYDLSPRPFERIRRITGYLVGTMDRWNDAKTAEEADRVKHPVGGC